MGLNGATGLRRRVESAKRDLRRKPESAIGRSSARIVADMKRRVVEADAVASTELFRGIEYRRRGSRFIIQSRAGHSGYVEFGTGPKHITNPYTRHYSKPDFSPQLVGALTEWASEKPSLRGIVDNPTSFAFAVARNISGDAEGAVGGTEAQPFFIPAWKSGKTRLIGSVRHAVRSSI